MLRGAHNDEFQELLDKFDFELWLDDEGVEYTVKSGSSGEQINVKTCPRCGGSDNKVFINRDTGLGNCFHGSCVGEPGFNKFTFIKHYTGDTGRVVSDIIKQQAEEMGWRPKREKRIVKITVPDSVEYPKSLELPIKGRNLKYLTNRGISPLTTKTFGLRYCKEGYYWYDDVEGKRRRYDFSNRVVIPVCDADGKVVTFQGRDITGKADRKYLFPPGLPSTGRYLYNAHNVTDQRNLVMGEGVFDVVAVYQALQEYQLSREYAAIGSFGISFSTGPGQQLSELTKLIDRGVRSLTFIWDGSTQAVKSAFRYGIEIKQWTDIDVYIAILPDDKDPNEVPTSVVIGAIAGAVPATKMNYVKFMAKRRG